MHTPSETMENGLREQLTSAGFSIPEKVGRTSAGDATVVKVGPVEIGGRSIVVIAGPCSVESRDQLHETALAVRSGGAAMLRGGAFKPRSSPYSFQGLGQEGLELLGEIRAETRLPVVTEVLDVRQFDQVAAFADMIQIGSRNMQNFALLKEAGQCHLPVLLKRGMMATIEEFLLAAEYLLSQGNDQVVLCERGIRTFETSTRNTLDLSAVPMLKRLSHLPVMVDPSHGTGLRWMVPAMAKAALAVGADGLIIEVHRNPATALSDGQQSLYPDEFSRLMADLIRIAPAFDREIFLPEGFEG